MPSSGRSIRPRRLRRRARPRPCPRRQVLTPHPRLPRRRRRAPPPDASTKSPPDAGAETILGRHADNERWHRSVPGRPRCRVNTRFGFPRCSQVPGDRGREVDDRGETQSRSRTRLRSMTGAGSSIPWLRSSTKLASVHTSVGQAERGIPSPTSTWGATADARGSRVLMLFSICASPLAVAGNTRDACRQASVGSRYGARRANR